MEAIYNYTLASGLCLLLLYVFYMLVLRTFPRNGFKRLYLLLTPLLAIVIPLLKLPLPVVHQYLPAAILPDFWLPEIIVTGNLPTHPTAPESWVSLNTVLAIVYVLVVFVLLVKLAKQLLQLRKLAKTATKVTQHTTGATILHTENHATFAFLNYIFLSNQPHLTEQEQQQVLAHELAHVQLGHSYDVLYYEVLSATLWFNPLVWLLKAELRDVHEYQADAEVVQTYQPELYSSLLAKEALYRNGIPVGNHFYKPQVFKRLHMLQRRNNKTTIVRPLLALPLLLLMVLMFSARDVTADMVQRLTAPVAKPSESPVPENASAPLIPTPETIDPNSKVPETIATPDEPQPTAIEQKPFEYVEQMPAFKGGDLALQKFIFSNLQYPAPTREAGRSGLVIVSFVISVEGEISEVTILKGLDEAADQEAKRVIHLMQGKWQPGTQNGQAVPVKFTLPIRFSLAE